MLNKYFNYIILITDSRWDSMKRKQIIVLILCIMLILSFIMLTSYAYWRVQKTQTGTNDIAGACLNISLVQAKDSNNY